ncbi:UTRA domain-containing protein [Phytoactinopolyspora limicola]|uniref:UTRA domain-containing protein n=1 Tax=Phytoactinopolyspora limicola TaxID=2715536 RepID=UPI001409A95A|nr:UTRA domain-containing protein [Phytoactinopolyspora limicola]
MELAERSDDGGGADRWLQAVIPAPGEAELLDLTPGMPALRIESISWDADDVPFEYYRGYAAATNPVSTSASAKTRADFLRGPAKRESPGSRCPGMSADRHYQRCSSVDAQTQRASFLRLAIQPPAPIPIRRP